MKKSCCLTLFLLLLGVSCALACDHIDSGEGYVMWNSPVAPTEDEDGSTGPGTCSVCGEVIEPATLIPKLASQRAQETAPPAPPPTAPPTAPPTEVPTAVPTQAPTQAPAEPPKEDVTKAPSSDPAPVQPQNPSWDSASGTPVPTRVPDPTAAPQATPVPTAVVLPDQGSSGSSGQPTAQPDLSHAAPAPGGNSGTSVVVVTSTAGAGRSGSGTSGKKKAGRDPVLYPVFSSRFPWRRLRMTPEENLYLHLAGWLVWPMPEASSPLQTLILLGP